jgi:hypothetical protein
MYNNQNALILYGNYPYICLLYFHCLLQGTMLKSYFQSLLILLYLNSITHNQHNLYEYHCLHN